MRPERQAVRQDHAANAPEGLAQQTAGRGESEIAQRAAGDGRRAPAGQRDRAQPRGIRKNAFRVYGRRGGALRRKPRRAADEEHGRSRPDDQFCQQRHGRNVQNQLHQRRARIGSGADERGGRYADGLARRAAGTGRTRRQARYSHGERRGRGFVEDRRGRNRGDCGHQRKDGGDDRRADRGRKDELPAGNCGRYARGCAEQSAREDDGFFLARPRRKRGREQAGRRGRYPGRGQRRLFERDRYGSRGDQRGPGRRSRCQRQRRDPYREGRL